MVMSNKIKTEVTRGSLNRMLKYFRNKNISIYYEHNDELGGHWFDSYVGKYDRFKINDSKCPYDDIYFIVTFFKNDEVVFKVDFYKNVSEFYGLGRIKISNDGPYCYLIINKITWWQRWILSPLVIR